MAILDIQIVATSLPSIQEALAIRPDQKSWIQTSYLIAEGIAIPLTSWLTRVLSHGLFHRAILQSPGLPTGRKTVLTLTPLKHAEQLGLDYAHSLTGDNAIRLLYGDGIKRY